MKTIKSRTTCKLNVAVLVIYGLVTLDLILALGVGAASDPTFTTIDSQEATYTASSRIGRNVSTQEDDFSAQANVLKVPRDFATIQAAVKAASPGDTIRVAAGVYVGKGSLDGR